MIHAVEAFLMQQMELHETSFRSMWLLEKSEICVVQSVKNQNADFERKRQILPS